MKTIEDFQQDIADSEFALRGAKSETRRDKLQHRITYARRRIRDLQGKDARPLTDEEFDALSPEEYVHIYPLVLRMLHLEAPTHRPRSCPDALPDEVEQTRRDEIGQRAWETRQRVMAETHDGFAAHAAAQKIYAELEEVTRGAI